MNDDIFLDSASDGLGWYYIAMIAGLVVTALLAIFAPFFLPASMHGAIVLFIVVFEVLLATGLFIGCTVLAIRATLNRFRNS